ncbi:MAG: tRNA lysidine(34) synthetase TilS [Betaproteobacteria bacterium]|nr:MAG: tRNA lysidine(34) synthetase TilS [Betaproteobacteria bacterium]
MSAACDVLDAHGVRRCSVCVGLSGGLDSVVLLQAMTRLANSFELDVRAVHVNHGLQPVAADWARFCHDLCSNLGVPLTVEKVVVARDSGLGIEAAARAERYAVFARVKTQFLALAHHQDDQVETFLLQLLRGAGAKGLSAMPVERSIGDGGPRLLRPLLTLTRSELADFAAANGLEWIEDASNADLELDRNYLRHSVLPVIERRFPAYRSTLSRVSRNLAEAAELAEILGQQDLEQARVGEALLVDTLRSWPAARALNALRSLVSALDCAVPHRAVLTEALRQAFEARQDARVQVDFGESSLRRYRGALFVVKNVPVPLAWRAVWTGESQLALPSGLGQLRFRRSTGSGLSAAALRGNKVSIAFRSGGERMALADKRPHRELKKHYQEAGVAPWLRERTPLVYCGRELVFVPGLGAAAEFQARDDEESWEIEWAQA